MMTHRKIEFRMNRNPWRYNDSVSVRILCITNKLDGSRSIHVAQPVEFVERHPENLGVEIPETIELQGGEAQQIMDELWTIGIRPTEGAGSAGQMLATQMHLEDMRRLVFDRKADLTSGPRRDIIPSSTEN